MSLLIDEPYNVEILVNNPYCKCSEKLREKGISNYQIIDVRSIGNDVTRHLLSVPAKQVADLEPDIKIEKEDTEKDSTLICFDSIGCVLCKTIISEGSFLLKGSTLEDKNFLYEFVSPNSDVFGKIINSLESSGLEIKIQRLEKFQRKTDILTENQEKVLWFAHKLGFFEFPRKIHMKELSEALGISLSTLSESMRRALRNLVNFYFK